MTEARSGTGQPHLGEQNGRDALIQRRLTHLSDARQVRRESHWRALARLWTGASPLSYPRDNIVSASLEAY